MTSVLVSTALVILAVMPGMAEAQNIVPLPRLPQGPIEMRVAYVVNSRLHRMTPAQLQILLAATQTTAREHFGVDLRFSPVVEIPIEKLFAQLVPKRVADARPYIYDFKTGRGDFGRFAKAFAEDLKKQGGQLPELIEYARPHIGAVSIDSYEALGTALARLQLDRIERWKNVKALDGTPAIDASPYNEYFMWLALGYSRVPFELLLTNQIIASVEYLHSAVHSAIRGGYSNGLATYSRSSRVKTVSVWSTFAFTTDDPWVREMREGESYSPQEAARLAGIGATHEIGHQLFHLLHPYGRKACLMNPVPMFAYRAWAAQLSPKDCPIGSGPDMRPGGYQFHY